MTFGVLSGTVSCGRFIPFLGKREFVAKCANKKHPNIPQEHPRAYPISANDEEVMNSEAEDRDDALNSFVDVIDNTPEFHNQKHRSRFEGAHRSDFPSPLASTPGGGTDDDFCPTPDGAGGRAAPYVSCREVCAGGSSAHGSGGKASSGSLMSRARTQIMGEVLH
jgi:hypothetical protein